MFKIIRRTSQILAFFIVYGLCAYGYMESKGFAFVDGVPTLVRSAQASETEFAHPVKGNIIIDKKWIRSSGNDNAPITLYMYSSMICSHCNDFHRYTLPKIKRDFVSKGLIKLNIVQFPLDGKSFEAAQLAYCLPPEKYEDFITKLYKNRDWMFASQDETLDKYALDFGLTTEEIKQCRNNKRLKSDILMTKDNGIRTLGIRGTPAFVIETEKGKELIEGAKKYDDLKEYFNNVLKKRK